MHCNMILNSEENFYECYSFLYVSDKQDNCSLQDYDHDMTIVLCVHVCYFGITIEENPLPHASFIEYTYVLLLALQ